MSKKFVLRRICLLMSAAGLLSMHTHAMASAFMLWEQDAASIANYHAGVAAIANDASTNWYNPAGLTNIPNQQLILGVDPVITSFKFSGTVANNKLRVPFGPQRVSVDGGTSNYIPFGHYVAPINDRIALGLSVGVPFGLKTDYGSDSFSRYSATLTKVQVIDVSPSIAFAVTNKFSLGLGFDWQRLSAELSEVVGAILPMFDSYSRNTGNSTGWGYHAGALYKFNPQTRIGLSYHSQVSHTINGHSTLNGPIANGMRGGTQSSDNFKVSATLPATTSFGLYHAINPSWDFLGHVSYTQWSVLKNLTLQNVAGVSPFLLPTNSLTVVIPEHYRNSWNVSLGTNYHPCTRWILRAGIGYDQTPSSDTYRNLQLPDSDRIALGFGGGYQFTRNIAVDAGYTHLFAMGTNINNLHQVFGPETITTNGPVKSSADVFGVQLKWDMA